MRSRARLERHLLAGLWLFRHASEPMLCLSAPVPDSDPRHAVTGWAAWHGVGIELIDILPR